MNRSACLAILLCACDPAVAPDAPTDGASVADLARGAPAGDGALGDAASVPTDLASPDWSTFAAELAGPRVGRLALFNVSGTENGTPTVLSRLYGDFQDDQANGCTSTVVASCAMTTCTGTGQDRSAGTITVGSASTIMVRFNVLYLWSVRGMLEWAQAAPITVSGSGADVPAFTRALVMPAPMVLVAPAVNSPPPLRSSDLTFSWTGGSRGVWVTLSGIADASRRTAQIECFFPASAGTGTVPSALLSRFAAGNVSITVDSVDADLFSDGGWAVLVAAAASATDPSGTLVRSYLWTFQ